MGKNHTKHPIGPNRPITRRDFIRGTAFTIAGLSLGINIFGCEKRPAEFSPSVRKTNQNKSRVILVRNDAVMDEKHVPKQSVVEAMMDKAILSLNEEKDPIVAWKTYFKPSDTVGIKMNMMMTATHLEVVRAIVKNLHAVGVADEKIIIWDRDNAGIGYAGIENRDRHFGFNKGDISTIVTDHCTALINVPGTKVHWLAGIGVALKNWLGAVTNINTKDRFVSFALHGDSCAEVCSINAIPVIRDKCRVVIVDALRPLFHGGPQVDPKYLWDYKGLLMSTDPVAIDTVCLKILQEKRNEFRGREWQISPPAKHIYVADKKYGLGNSDWNKIELHENSD